MTLPEKLPRDDGAVYLIDGNNFLFRAYHALPALSAPDGTPTNAVHGFVRMLHALRRDAAPPYLLVVFDAGKETFRNRLYPGYKAHRPEPPEDLVPQFALVRKVVEALRVPWIERPDMEADDIIATIAKTAHNEGHPVVIVSSDKDLMQLVTDGPPPIYVYDTMKQVLYDEVEVEKKFGVPPAKVGDLLALVGDTSDNIPGIRGIGPKTAASLLAAYGDLEGVLAHAAEIRQPKRRERILTGADDARLSRKLVALRTDVDVPPLAAYADPGPDLDAAREVLEELGFRSILRALSAEAGKGAAPPPPGSLASEPIEIGPVGETIPLREKEYRILPEPSPEDLVALWTSFGSRERVGLAMLLSEPDAMRARPLALALAAEGDDAPAPTCIWLGVPPEAAADPTASLPPRVRERIDTCSRFLRELSGAMVVSEHKAAFEAWEENDGILPLPYFDVAVASYTLDPARSTHDMASLAHDMFALRLPAEAQVRGKGARAKPWVAVEPEAAGTYLLPRAEAALSAARHLGRWIDAAGPAMKRLFYEVEMPLSGVLRRMERKGVLLDADALEHQRKDLSAAIARIREAVESEAGHPVNLDSPQQLRKLLFEERGLPPGRKTKTGYSTEAKVLEELAALDPIVSWILEYRSLAKLKSTYLDTLPRMIHPRTGRLHTRYRQTVAQTGRLSSIEPNLQNIPVRTEHGRRIREAFRAPEGHCLVAMDYSQIELRVLAHLSQDPNLLEVFRRGGDIHARTAAEIFDVDESEVTPEQRRIAKAVNFGVIYGQSPFGLARQLGIPRGQASLYIRRYFERIPGVAAYLEEVAERARHRGYAETVLGRRRRIPELASRGAARAHGERIARNTPVQGSAADIMKLAMVAVGRAIEDDPDMAMILTIHDELIFECRSDAVDRLVAKAQPLMEGAFPLDVPLVVHVGVGRTWADCKT